MEKKIRSIVKSAVWRVFATLNAFVVAFVFLANTKQSLKISIVANISGLILYYIHERVWNKISWKRGES